MKNKHFYILSAVDMKHLRSTLKQCHQVLDYAMTNGIFIDEAGLEEPIGACLWYFRKEPPQKQLMIKELDEMF